MGIIRITKRWRMACCLSLLAFVAVSLSAVGAFSVRPTTVLAQADTYVADTSSQVGFSSLTSGARYLLCQFATKTQKYEVLDGSTNSTKQIPFATPDYSTLANLQSGASSVASRYVSLVKVDEAHSYWYIRRNSDNYYFSSNASSDLVFSESGAYFDSNRTYFVPSSGSASDTIRFSVYNDTGLFLGTKVEGAYFDTWHDGSSTATKDFILYRVYNQDEEAANYAASFVSAIGSVCSADGNTATDALHSAWAGMGTAWGKVSSSAQSVITSVTANPDSAASITAQCKAKYLYIVGKYSLDSSINDFMGLGTSGLVSLPFVRRKEDDGGSWVVAVLSFLGVFFGGLLILSRKKRRRKE
jgi:hypothetical protein